MSVQRASNIREHEWFTLYDAAVAVSHIIWYSTLFLFFFVFFVFFFFLVVAFLCRIFFLCAPFRLYVSVFVRYDLFYLRRSYSIRMNSQSAHILRTSIVNTQ